jgi:4-amino-4-deoxy-L-arabinose transferase-like glycosyltransferase
MYSNNASFPKTVMSHFQIFPLSCLYRKLLYIVLAAFVVRLAVRCYSGSADFWNHGYVFFFEVAQNIAAGKGTIAGRVPLYPVFLAGVTLGHKVFLPIVVSQSLIGAGTVLCAALLARQMFSDRAAITAALLTSFYPYYVIHDTALQETSLYTLLTALAVLLLLRVSRSGSSVTAMCAGLTLGAAVLTRPSLAPFALFGPLWLAFPGVFRAGTWYQACCVAILCWGAAALTLAPWFVSSTGQALSSPLVGHALWIGNNTHTFSHYPVESIDRSTEAAFGALSAQERADLKAEGPRWYWRRTFEFVCEHPSQALTNNLRKIGAAFGWLPSPRQSLWPNLVYLFSYGFVMIVGLLGMWLERGRWREHLVFYALFVSFAIITAIFWGHTSHRAYLDVYWIVFAAGLLDKLRRRYFPLAMKTRSGDPLPVTRWQFFCS